MPSTQRSKTGNAQPGNSELESLAQLFKEGSRSAAEALARSLTARFPEHGFGWKVLGAILLQGKCFEESLLATQQAIRLLPADASSLNNLGSAFLGIGKPDQAETCFRKALSMAPGYPKAHFNMSQLMRAQGKLDEAQTHCQSAIDSNPGYALAHFGLGNLLEMQNRVPEAIASYRTGLALEPGNTGVFNDMLHLMSHDVHTSAADNLEMHLAYGRQVEGSLQGKRAPHTNSKQANRCLKVGFVASDAYDHALANYLEPLFRLLNKKPGLEVHLYYTNTKEDAVTTRMRTYFRHWHDVAALNDDALEQRIRSDGIDILVDVNGHTVLNRLLTFARKPAPIQMSWLGYLGTTGLQAMDYYVSDTYCIPPGQLDWQFQEKLAYLPAAVVFEPNANAPKVNALPALNQGFITYGSFNRHNKINDAVIALWSMLMNSVPHSRLKLGGIPEMHRAGMQARFAAHGVEAERLRFSGRTVQTEYLALHQGVDFCLDTFPFCGGATIAHAAWMGVPTLTLAGELPASRLGATEMHHLGLDGFVADSIEDFLDKGRYWASHLEELAALRAGMRERFSQSALGQTVAFADHFEAMLRTAWQRWCQDFPATSFAVAAGDTAGNHMRLPDRQADTEPSEEALEALVNLYARQEHKQLEALARQLTVDYPAHGAGWKYLGAALRKLGCTTEALAVLQETVTLRPDDYEAHFNLAAELQQQGLFDDAVRSYLHALTLQPNNPSAYNNLANIFKMMNLFPQAEIYYRQALTLRPDMAIAINNLANALHAQGKYSEAESHYREALRLKPDWAEAYNNLAICLKDQGYGSEAKEAYRKALSLKEDWAAARSNLLFSLSLDVQTTPQELQAEHLAFGQLFEPRLQARRVAHSNSKQPERALQIGFVSADLYDHAMASFLQPLFAGLANRPELTLHAYYTHIFEDAVTKRMRTSFHAWNKVSDLSEDELAEKIRADQIDILIDLSGHTAYNRLLTFAQKPAPVQASYLGYLGTTGLQSMDYYLCDEYWVPPGQLDWQFTEKMAYLPGSVCFEPSPHSAEVSELPALQNGHITFGSFNRPNKLNPSVIALWSMLLQAVPTARMVLGGISAERQEELFRRFLENGVDINRLTFFPRANIQEYLAMHHQVDFCLDTFPYGGGATNANAAWMGVPTLCLAGESPASRFGPAEMHILGLDGFIAEDIEDFIAKGVQWSQRVPELAALRASMRQRFNASHLGQPQQFADHFASLLRAMWKRWCNDLPPATLRISDADTQTAKTQETAPDDAINALVDQYESGDLAEAERMARAILQTRPGVSAAWSVLAQIHQRQNRFEDALLATEQVLAHNPRDAATWNNRGVLFLALNRIADAQQALQQAVSCNPHHAKALVNLGSTLRELGQLEEAEQMCRRAVALDATDASALMAWGNALEAQGQQDEAQVCYYKADMAHEPRREVAHSNVLYLLNHDVLVTPEVLARETRAYGHHFEEPLKSARIPCANKAIADKRLRLGFVSGDFCNHALTGFLEPVFKALAQLNAFECHAYHTHTLVDETTQRMQSYFHAWSDVAHLGNTELAEQIRRDGIDILVDLSGHTARNRLPVFALKPAPVQISWIGFLGSTGLTGMDYYLCDEVWLPPASQRLFTETLAYLPNAVVFEPHSSLAPVNALPALSNGYLTFGSFNRLAKINDSVVALWAEILRRVPSSRLLLAGVEADRQADLLGSFVQQGVEASRLTMHPRLATQQYLELHHAVDICLDTFPHGGGATTANAICMGVPTLSLCGDSAASRFSGSLMRHVGFPEFVAYSIDQFIEKGVHWAEHPEQLVSVRATMRDAFLHSPLADYDGFATAFAASTRIMWKRWCASTREASEAHGAIPPLAQAELCAPVRQAAPPPAATLLPTAPQLFGKLNAPYYVVTPPFRQTSGGIRAMHYLCHALNLIGQEAYVDTPTVATHLRTPVLTEDIKAFHIQCGRKPIVIYPEIVNDNPMNAEHVVRYLLNNPGKINSRPIKWKTSDLIYTHGVELIPDGVHAEVLQIPLIDRSVYFNCGLEPSHRKGSLVFINRYIAAGGKLDPLTDNATEISFRVPNRSPEELSALYNSAEVLYAYEQSTSCYEAMLCGCPVIYIPNPVLLPKKPICHLGRGGWAWGHAPEQLAFAKATVHQVDLAYKDIERYFWDELTYFISLTQARTKWAPTDAQQELLIHAKDPIGAGIRLYERNDLDEALWQLLEASNRLPSDPISFVYIALVCARKGMAQQASEFLDHALSLAPGRNDFHAALGEAFLKAGSASDALPYFETALRNAPDLLDAYPAYAQALRVLGRTVEAVQFLEQKLAQAGGASPFLSRLLTEFRQPYTV